MTAYSKKLIIFDLDGTLAPSKSAMDAEMAGLLVKLMETKTVAVISGGGYPQFMTQFLHSLPVSSDKYSNLLLLPTSGTRMYTWKGSWVEVYAEHLTTKEKDKIMTALNSALAQVGYVVPNKTYGQIIEDRGSQITFSALGQSAPLDVKEAWDPDRVKRQKISKILNEKIPEFDVRVGGTTSVDITRRGVNKSYGIRKLEQITGTSLDQMVFVGDTLFPGGNDYPAKATGIDCFPVTGPEDTKALIKQWV